MSTVSLQTVFDEARQAIEAGAADKAIGIAQHILAHYPRTIEGLRLLGEAQLNAGHPEQAAESFERVLQADAENVAAYYGLGLARQSTDQRAAAITAFERALEIQPNLADLRTQLMRLYSETPGSAGQFRLSRAGLGRLYARGGMFGQAIDEFRAVLDADPSRDDVKVALAEALWRDGLEDEAADFCRALLDRQPDLLKPTVLLGYMQFASGQPEGETLWRRAAEQDAQMVLARTLFDILPPIRIEEPVLPEFDEAEWRAQEARRAAVEPVVAAPVAVADDDDFFADSWLGGAGTAQSQANIARAYDEAPTPSQTGSGENNDDDLLASLLGFDSFGERSAPAQQNVSDDVQPFTLGTWADEPTTDEASAVPAPVSLNDIGLEDSSADDRADVGGAVQPFSFDDWDFDQPSSSAQNTISAQDDISGVAAFSLDDLENDEPAAKPFSFESNTDELADVQPFSLDDDFGAEPFSFDSNSVETAPANTADADAGLGDVKPFSLDEWGLDDDQLSTTASDSAPNGESNDLGDLKPFSLDELSLDSLDAQSEQALSGPGLADEDVAADEPTEFTWQEPSWRSQTPPAAPAPTEGQEESIFAKLLRNRSADSPTPTPEPLDQQADDEDATFFSLDDESLRLDSDDTDEMFNIPSAAEQTQAEQQAPAVGTAASALDESSDADPTPFSFDDLGLNDAEFPSFDNKPTLTDDTASANAIFQGTDARDDTALPFSLDDLGLDDDVLRGLDQQPEPAVDSNTDSSADTTAFSLDDLGLDDESTNELSDPQPFSLDAEAADELIVRDAATPDASFSWDDLASGDQPSSNVDQPSTFSLSDLGLDEDFNVSADGDARDTTADEPEMSPFSLSELGLSDDEIAAFNFDDPDGDVGQKSFDASTSNTDSSRAVANQFDDAASEPEMVPFSLSELGLTDDEIALLDQESTADDEGQSLADIFGDDVNVSAQDTTAPIAEEQAAFAASDDMTIGEEDQAPSSGDAAVLLSTDAPEMVPFSLADLGLSDEELALFDDAPTAQSAEADQQYLNVANEAQEAADLAEPSAADAFAQLDEAQPTFGEAALPADEVDVREDMPVGQSLAEAGDFTTTSEESLQTRDQDASASIDESFASAPTEPLVDPQEAAAEQMASASFAAAGLGAIFAQMDRDPTNDTLRLAVARMSQQTDQSAQALEQYKHLIKRGQLLDDVVDDLQDAIADTDDPQLLRRLHRLLGDAYMKQNRFREAMDEYSWTLARP